MSRGPGRIQRTIDALIAGDEHGAWLVSDICEHAYPEFEGVEKKHQVAVNRALSSMALPESWEARYSEARGGTRVLYNARDPESCVRADRLTKRDGSWGDYRNRHLSERREPEIDKRAHEAHNSCDTDELSGLDRRFEKTKAYIAFLESAGAHEAMRHWTDELRSLEKRRSKLVTLSRQN